MPVAAPLVETRLNGLPPHRQGKVRDIYDVGDALLLVATDRISAFDYVLASGIPDKGKVLTQLSAFWFEQMEKPRPDGGGAIHVVIWVPYEQAQARIAAALAAGGRIVRDAFAPSWWTLADAAGNEADIATTTGRD